MIQAVTMVLTTQDAQGGDMTLSEARIKETADLLKARDHARNMVTRWQTKLDEVEATLGLILVPETEAAPEPAPEPV